MEQELPFNAAAGERVINGVSYRKVDTGYTLRQYYSHSTPEKGPGPGWDARRKVLEQYNVSEPSELPDEPHYVMGKSIRSAMDNKEQIKQRMMAEGFSIINEYNDPPNEFFPDHDHPGDQLLVVLEGSIEIAMNGKVSTLKPGDEITFPAKVMHSAKVGSEGCLYLDGERPVGEKGM